MNDLFGLSMTYIMIALLIILGVSASTVVWVIVRNRVMFLIGVRNIPRRRAQTILIIIGLMLSTLIISTAFSIGDTVDYSITNQVYDKLHSVDEIVQFKAADDEGGGGGFGGQSLVSPKAIPQAQADRFSAAFRATSGVDGAVEAIRGPVPATNVRAGQTEPLVLLTGVDPAQLKGFESDIVTIAGERAPLDALGPDEVYANESAADKLDIQRGDALQVYVGGVPHTLTVRDIVKDRVLTGWAGGASYGLVTTLGRAQELLNRAGQVDYIAVSNDGGVRDGESNSLAIKKTLNDDLLKNSSWAAAATKHDLADIASQAASFLTTFFVVLGLFSIAAGMLLIFLIFVMLAAERKMEMGMIRAVGTKRSHLVQMFMSEGMAYNTIAAAVGCGLGIAVSLVMVRIMAALFSGFSLSIAFHVTARSLIVSYSLGVVLTFLTVTFSSWRIGNLNIVSAIRDAADPLPLSTRPEWRGGIGMLLRYAKWLVFKPSKLSQWGAGIGLLLLVPVSGAITAGLFGGAIAIYGSSSAASIAAVLLGVAGILTGGLTIVLAGASLNYIFQTAAIAIVLGAALVALGLALDQAAPYALGVSLVLMGAALGATMLRVPARLAFTTMGLVVLVYWLLSAGNYLPPYLSGGIEMFFLSGITMVIAATFVLVYNADLMLALLTSAGNRFSYMIPSIRTAVAYPLANKFRTGMTVAMISLVMFALVMMSTMNSNFSRIFLSDDALGGYDVMVQENPNNPISDLAAAYAQQGGDASVFASVGNVALANRRIAETRNKAAEGAVPEKFQRYTVATADNDFLTGNGVKFQARATGYNSDAEIWRAIASDPGVAVIDANALASSGGFGPGQFSVSGLKSSTTTFSPPVLELRDAGRPEKVREVKIIGVVTTKASLIFGGLLLNRSTFDDLYDKPESTIHFVRLRPGTDARATARSIEKALLAQGVQADSIRKLIDDLRAQNRGFTYLIQGFMGIGLFVGIAAVGVIAFRTVVERRQQIGMLRAIGYTRNAVAISFIMESSFVTLLGILSGIGLALLLAYQLVKTDDFVAGGVQSFYVPWLEITAIGVGTFIASVLMTIIPSRQASSVPIAEALRYE